MDARFENNPSDRVGSSSSTWRATSAERDLAQNGRKRSYESTISGNELSIDKITAENHLNIDSSDDEHIMIPDTPR